MKQTLSISLKAKCFFKVVLFLFCFSISQLSFSQNYGDLDPSFNNSGLGYDSGIGPNGQINSTVVQPDGKILIGGNFTSYSSQLKNRIARVNENGLLDAMFNIGSGANQRVNVIVLQPDGKILLGGEFTTFNGIVRNRIARLNADGSLDTTFDPGSGTVGTYAHVNSMVLQGDGKILIGGNFTTYNGSSVNRIARLNVDGSLDTTFNTGSGANNYVFSITLQSDGKILIGGAFTSINGNTLNNLARLNSDGSLDGTFNTGAGANGNINSIAIQTDGQIVIGGTFTSYNTVNINRLARLNSNGSIDSTFNVGTGADNDVYPLVLQPDGKILIGGNFSNFNGNIRKTIARLNTDGSIDPTFNPFSNNYTTLSIALQPDGKILLDGSFTSDPLVSFSRLNPDGQLDTAFNPSTGVDGVVNSVVKQQDGKLLIVGAFTTYNGISRNRFARVNIDGTLDLSFNPGSGIAAVGLVALQSDGKILIGGGFTSYNGVPINHIARLNPDGSLDSTFSSGLGISGGGIGSIVVQVDGKILIGGSFKTYNGVSKEFLARLNPDGTLDNSFSSPLYTITQYYQVVYRILVQPDNKILIAGSFTNGNGSARSDILRLNSNGSLDISFNSGNSGTGGSVGTAVQSLALQPDGKILIGGEFTSYNNVEKISIARLNANGTLDPTFNSGLTYNDIYSIILQDDKRILIAGSFSTYDGQTRGSLARLNPYGDLDTSFNLTGANTIISSIVLQDDNKVVVGGPFTSFNGSARNRLTRLNGGGTYVDPGFQWNVGTNGTVNSITVQQDNNVIIGGYFTTYHRTAINSLARLNADGPIDTTFNTGLGVNGTVISSVIQSNGKILIGGQFTSYNGVTRNNIARLNSDGSLDTSFNPGVGTNSHINSIVLQSDGKILIGGNFTSYNGITKKYIARLNADGSLDTSFNTGTGISVFQVNCITVQADGKILIGGQFTTYDGMSRNRIARLNANGSLDTSFNPGTGANNMVLCIKPQSDGKIIISGGFTSYNGATANRIARLNTDGSLDTTLNFGTGADNIINDMVIQSNGKIIIVGAFSTFNGSTANSITRLNPDGTIDPTLDFGVGANGQIFAVALQTNNKILIGGNFSSYNGMVRKFIAQIDNNEPNFGPGTGANQGIYSVVSQPDNKIVIGGLFTTYNGIDNKHVARLNADGSLDNSFVIGNGFDGSVFSLNLQPDGKIIAGGGFSTYNGVARNNIARLNIDGSLDTSFNPGSGTNQGIVSTALQADGKILIGGDFLIYNGVQRDGIARLNPDGTLDTTFNTGLGTNNQFVRTIVVQPDGKILIGGNFTLYNGASRNYIARLNPDGTLDTTFDSNTGASSPVRTIVLQPDGKILVGGDFFSFNGVAKGRIVRLNSDGSLDGTFVGVGVDQSVSAMALQSNGKILIGGAFTSYDGISKNYIAYLNSDGTLNSTMDLGTGFNNSVESIVIRSNNKAIIGGFFTSYNGIEKNRVTELDFNVLGVVDYPIKQQDILIYSKRGAIEVVSEKQLINSIDVFDIRGVNLYTNHKINSLTYSFPSHFLKNQLVIVKVMNEMGATSTKKLICN